MDEILQPLKRFVELAEMVNKAVSANEDWELTWMWVFDKLAPKIRETGVNFTYYDPDTSYEDEVLCYLSGLNSKLEQVKVMIEKLEKEQ